MLKHLLVGRYIAIEAPTSPLHQTTFETLIEGLDEPSLLPAELNNISSGERDRLITALVDLSRPAVAPSPPADPAPSGGRRSPHTDGPVLSSIQAERLLTDAVAALRVSPRFAEIRFARLGEFWRDDWARAPFEEALTFQQLADLKITALLEKRSFGHAKVLAVIGAIEHAIGRSSEPAPATATVEPSPTQPKPVALSSPRPQGWGDAGRATLPSHTTATLHYLESLATDSTLTTTPIGAIITHLPHTLSPLEAVVVWFHLESPLDVVASLVRLAPPECARVFGSAREKLDRLFTTVAPETRQSWEIALRHAAVPLQVLLRSAGATRYNHAGLESIARILIGALGGVHPLAFGHTLPGYYTLTPSAVELIIAKIVAGLPQNFDSVALELTTLLPWMERDDTEKLLRLRATHDETTKRWITLAGPRAPRHTES